MTTEEFSNEFDIAIDSYRRFKAYDNKEMLDSLEFNEYEKSVFLTEAQESIVLELYSGKNVFRDSFESTEEIREKLSNLVRTMTGTPMENKDIAISDNSYFFKLPDDVWFITYEDVDTVKGTHVMTIPVTQDEYHISKNNPFRQATDKRVLRMDHLDDTVELISPNKITRYLVKYLSKPEPIILINLPNDLTINNIGKKTECKLDPVIHRAILDRAVRLAITSKVPSTGNK